ncbi:MAG: HD domain-containing protein [Methanotrichaceae archaeon]|nr:HD domain-containing protein [Methanotrichaceae archaeon]
MLVDRFKGALGKSKGRQSLYNHCLSSTEIALQVAEMAGEKPGPRLDRLVFATFIHDVGKLDPNFQAMLEAVSKGQKLPAKKVKHEASTFDYDLPQLVLESKEEIQRDLQEALGYRLDLVSLDGAMEHIWAFAVSHHGLFYLSYERGRDQVLRPLIRRQWTSFYPNEERRITLVDLLFEYHRLGGLVMISDLVASYCYEKGKDYQALFGEVESLVELVERLIERSGEIEAGMDERDYGLRETLMLVGGGLR